MECDLPRQDLNFDRTYVSPTHYHCPTLAHCHTHADAVARVLRSDAVVGVRVFKFDYTTLLHALLLNTSGNFTIICWFGVLWL